MACTHKLPATGIAGQTTQCASCPLTFIHNGSGWKWEYDIPKIIRRDLKTAYRVKMILNQENRP